LPLTRSHSVCSTLREHYAGRGRVSANACSVRAKKPRETSWGFFPHVERGTGGCAAPRDATGGPGRWRFQGTRGTSIGQPTLMRCPIPVPGIRLAGRSNALRQQTTHTLPVRHCTSITRAEADACNVLAILRRIFGAHGRCRCDRREPFPSDAGNRNAGAIRHVNGVKP
jgi:hypothetical protein